MLMELEVETGRVEVMVVVVTGLELRELELIELEPKLLELTELEPRLLEELLLLLLIAEFTAPETRGWI